MNIERRGNPTMPFFRQNSQSHQCPLPAEYRGAPMAEGKNRAPPARRRGLATVLLTALLSLAAQTGRWRQVAGMAYGVARALGVEVGSSLAGGDGQFGYVRGAAWSTLTRHLSPARTGSAAERLGTR